MNINCLQKTWTTGCAWEKAYHKWKEQQDDAIAAMGAQSAVARFRDFKVHMDPDHVTNTFANNLLPFDASGNPFLPGEWDASQIVIPNDGAPGVTNEYFLQMNGASSATSKSIIEGYAFSRAYPTEPDPASPAIETSWMNRMQDVGDNSDDIVQNAQDHNRNLPYDQTAYPGGATNASGMERHRLVTFTASNTSGVGVFNIAGGSFACGLIQFANTSEETVQIEIMLIPGLARGYLTDKMEDF